MFVLLQFVLNRVAHHNHDSGEVMMFSFHYKVNISAWSEICIIDGDH